MPSLQLRERELPPAGSHLATCCGVIQLGTQRVTFEGKTDPKEQIRIQFELPDECRRDGRPFLLGRTFTYSSDPRSALRCEIESWLGRPLREEEFDSSDLADRIGCTAVVGVNHAIGRNGITYANLTSILRPPKEVSARRELLSLPLLFSFSRFDVETFRALPNWMQETISRSPEYQKLGIGGPPAEGELADQVRQRLAIPAAAPAPRVRPAAPRTAIVEDLDDGIPFASNDPAVEPIPVLRKRIVA
jgi:hypothetical protein